MGDWHLWHLWSGQDHAWRAEGGSSLKGGYPVVYGVRRLAAAIFAVGCSANIMWFTYGKSR